MPKNIFFLADGTWNGPNQGEEADNLAADTNVFKLFLATSGKDDPNSTKLANEQERRLISGTGDQSVQVAKYINGVGDSNNELVRLLGGIFGAGLIARVIRGYTFISRNYKQGDQIYICGFSRGAYTARALANFICVAGLLDSRKIDMSDKSNAYRLAAAVWYSYQKQTLAKSKTLLGKLENFVTDLPGFFMKDPVQDLVSVNKIWAVGVWDTVGSLGFPEYNSSDDRINALALTDAHLHTKVQYGFQALAVDERRADFTPTLWTADPRIVQCLFPGAHSDVGGGYPETGLSDGALLWMKGKFEAAGVKFVPLAATPKPTGPAHAPWDHLPFNLLPQAQRALPKPPPGLRVHQSVVDRINKKCVPDPGKAAAEYFPANLVPNYFDRSGKIKPGIEVEPHD